MKTASIELLNEAHICQEYIDGLNDPEVNKFLPTPRTGVQTAETIATYIRKNRAAGNLLYGLFIENKLIGTVRLHDFDYGRCTVGIALFDKSEWGKGWGRYCVDAMVEYAKEIGCSCIFAGIEMDNVRSRNLFSACDFLKYGASIWVKRL